MATFSRSERKRRPRDNKSAELTLHLKQAMTTAIKTDLYPKSQIDIFVQVNFRYLFSILCLPEPVLNRFLLIFVYNLVYISIVTDFINIIIVNSINNKLHQIKVLKHL